MADILYPDKSGNGKGVVDLDVEEEIVVTYSSVSKTLTQFGAIADARQVADANMTAGSPILNSATGNFTDDDIGKGIVVTGAGAAGVKLSSTIISRQLATRVTLANNAVTAVTNTGVTFGTNCGPALQAAITAARAEGGGSVIIDGHFIQTTSVSENFTVGNSPIQLLGFGSSSMLFVALTSSTATAVTIQNAQHLTVQGITFVGTQNEKRDAAFVFDLQGTAATFRDNSFYGLATNIANGAIINLGSGRLHLDSNHFGGCTGSSAFGACAVIANNFESVLSRNNRFIDYGTVGSILFTKTNLDTGYAWILTKSPSNNRVGNVISEGDFFDEGALYGIRTQPAAGVFMASVHIKGSLSNTSSAGRGYLINQAESAVVEDCSFGWTVGPPIEFNYCRTPIVRNLRLVDGANTLVAVGPFVVQEHDCYRINPDTSRTIGFGTYTLSDSASVVRYTDGKSFITKAGAIGDADFPSPPPNGHFGGIDTTNHRAYFKDGATWRYATLT